ncbi:hypothetical protein T10_5256 [Trichinella papuae]|uniref:Secreted protein n=1 Tax=Trichinella papuae TaxID=268474 RepID=A0A0V1MME8_9BILA|nr:hypothetical protein T10_5256 [Trichinella papuae]
MHYVFFKFRVILTLYWTVLAWERTSCASRHVSTSCQAYHRFRNHVTAAAVNHQPVRSALGSQLGKVVNVTFSFLIYAVRRCSEREVNSLMVIHMRA